MKSARGLAVLLAFGCGAAKAETDTDGSEQKPRPKLQASSGSRHRRQPADPASRSLPASNLGGGVQLDCTGFNKHCIMLALLRPYGDPMGRMSVCERNGAGRMNEYPVPNHKWVSVIEAPLYGQRLPAQSTDEELAEMLAEVERITKTIDSPLGWVTDVSNILRATPLQRKMYAESDERLKELDAKLCTGTAIICSGAFTRGIVTAVHWIATPVYPFKIFSSRREGERWARQQLIDRGIDISPEPQSLESQIRQVKSR